MSRVLNLNLLLVFVPVSIALKFLGHLDLSVFTASAIAIIPLAKLLGDSTEVLAGHYNPTAGALLNATFGNAPEIFISIAAISVGLPVVVLASITGSILGNVLLVLGMSLVAGGIRNKEMKFESFPFGLQASLLFIALTGLSVPYVFSIGTGRNVEFLSDTLAVVLIALYGLGLLFTFSTHKHLFAIPARGNDYPQWTVRRAMVVLGVSTILVALLSEILAVTINPVITALGVNPFFLGAVVIGIIGNVPEHLTAIQMGLKNKADIAIGIAAGSGAQVAIFVTPLIVLISELQGRQLTMLFTPYELVGMFAAALILMIVSYDGRSNWFEGVQLLAVYVILAAGFFFLLA